MRRPCMGTYFGLILRKPPYTHWRVAHHEYYVIFLERSVPCLSSLAMLSKNNYLTSVAGKTRQRDVLGLLRQLF